MVEVAVASTEVEAQEDPQTEQKEAMTMATMESQMRWSSHHTALVKCKVQHVTP